MSKVNTIKIDSANFGQTINSANIFICCGSYEARSKTIANLIDPSTIEVAIIAHNENLDSVVGENTRYLHNLFKSKIIAKMNSGSPLQTADALNNALGQVKSQKPLKYLIDITTFTHESLLILVKLLSLHLKPDDQALCVYVGAEEYSIGDDDEHKWLSKGVSHVRSVLGYPGEMHPSKLTHLIVMVGFEHERATSLIEEFEPDLLSLWYGRSGTESEKKHRASNHHFFDLLKTITSTYKNVRTGEFSCIDPLDTKDNLLKFIGDSDKYNVIIAPMNTKISTIGAALVALENEKIQLCYTQPRHYNYVNYSIPGNKCYIFNIRPFLYR